MSPDELELFADKSYKKTVRDNFLFQMESFSLNPIPSPHNHIRNSINKAKRLGPLTESERKQLEWELYKYDGYCQKNYYFKKVKEIE
jgi:hypothetical protein